MEPNEVEKFAKELGSPNDDIRDHAFHGLPAFLVQHRPTEFMDTLKLWKGLFYGLWNVDGYENQVERAEGIAACLVDTAIREEVRADFWKGCLTTLRLEWMSIDQYRLDKYYALARKMLNAAFRAALSSKWLEARLFADLEIEIMGNGEVSAGLPLHFVEIYFEELEKAMEHEERSELTNINLICYLFPFRYALTCSPLSFKEKVMKLVMEPVENRYAGRRFGTIIRALELEEEIVVKGATPCHPGMIEAVRDLEKLAPPRKKHKRKRPPSPMKRRRRNYKNK